MAINRNSIRQQKPAIFDWLVFSISLLMGLIFPELKNFAAAASFSYWMFVAMLLYMAGLWLKHRPVYYRLAKAGKGQSIPYVLFLIIGHWVIMLMLVIFSVDAMRDMAGLPKIPLDKSLTGWQLFGCIVLSLFISWLAFRPGGSNKKLLTDASLFRRELAGDILLISGVSILSFVFWEKSLLGAMEHMQLNSFGNICTLFIFLSVCYVLFYLPLRYLYLIEDHFSRQTWKRLLLIFMLILLRGLFEALRY